MIADSSSASGVSSRFMARTRIGLGRRWLLIQLHRAQIARILRSRSRFATEEVAQRMNAIALLCDCGRTEAGQRLAMTLARDGVLDLESMRFPSSELAEPS